MREPAKFGNYHLFERVAVGGMAEVFKAVSYGVEGFERLFAVKRVLPNISEDQEFIEMFIDEAKIAVQLHHANIGQIFELGREDGAYFIAMEFVQGKDLRSIFDRARTLKGTLDIPMCCHIIKEVCEALEYAHNKRNERQEPLNLVHRDVSPQNIIVSYDGEVKLIDFGIAKAAGKASKTQAGILKGKFGYMSPEQVRGKPIDRRSDLFSLSVVLFEILTLERCFQGESDFSTLDKVRNVDIRRPSSLNREIPAELERIILRGLSRNPNERYQNASEIQDALQKFLYQSGAFFSRKDLSAYMRATFKKELDAEARRLAEFREYARTHIKEAEAPAPSKKPVASKAEVASFKPDLPALSWEEDELATSVWDRSPSQIFAQDDLLGGPNRPSKKAKEEPTFDLGNSNILPKRQSPRPGLAAPPPTPTPAFTHPVDDVPKPAKITYPSPPSSAPQRGMWGRVIALLAIMAVAAIATVFITRSLRDSPKNGQITVESIPSVVTIFIDGQVVYEGPTPHTLPDISYAEHEVKVVADDHQTLSMKIQVTESNPQRIVKANLPKLSNTNSLEIESRPNGAKIYIDDVFIDETPLRTTNIQPGDRSLRIEKSGFQTWKGSVKVIENRPLKVQPIILYPNKVALTIMPEPAEAKVIILQPDGKRLVLGVGPQTYGIDNRGNVTVRFELDGYKPLEKKLPRYRDRKFNELLTMEVDPKASNSKLVPDDSPTEKVQPRQKKQPRKISRKKTPPRQKKTPPLKKTPLVKKTPVVNKAPGFLKLIAKPSAKVFIKGRDLGYTPIFKYKLPPGVHQVTLVRSKEPAFRKTISIVIHSEKVTLRKYAHP